METFITPHWDEYLSEFLPEQQDIYFREAYARLYETEEDVAFCFVCHDKRNFFLMPFLRRNVGRYFDFETPYGYGGPISNSDNEKWLERAIASLYECFAQEKYICGFVRFHPLLENQRFCQGKFEILRDRQTVSIPLDDNEEQIWKEQISSKNRNMIRKAEKRGLEFCAEYDFASMNGFVDLYESTMARVQAESFYYFPQVYYESFMNALKGKAFLGTVRQSGLLVCAALFMYSERYGHYHLSGGNRAVSSMGANNLMLWKAALEMKKLGVHEMHLGGGITSYPEDSLFKFKKTFSKNEKIFYIGKMIFNPAVYKEICGKWRMAHSDRVEQYGNRLLCYRY